MVVLVRSFILRKLQNWQFFVFQHQRGLEELSNLRAILLQFLKGIYSSFQILLLDDDDEKLQIRAAELQNSSDTKQPNCLYSSSSRFEMIFMKNRQSHITQMSRWRLGWSWLFMNPAICKSQAPLFLWVQAIICKNMFVLSGVLGVCI